MWIRGRNGFSEVIHIDSASACGFGSKYLDVRIKESMWITCIMSEGTNEARPAIHRHGRVCGDCLRRPYILSRMSFWWDMEPAYLTYPSFFMPKEMREKALIEIAYRLWDRWRSPYFFPWGRRRATNKFVHFPAWCVDSGAKLCFFDALE